MRGHPLPLEHRKVSRHLRGALGHQVIPRHEFDDLPGDLVERETVTIQDSCELRVRGEDG